MSGTYRIECIPNISSTDPELLRLISKGIQAVPGVILHFVDPGQSANRTVFTYTGPLNGVFKATQILFRLTLSHVDMRKHTGVHPRMGAVDVCPFVLLDDPCFANDFKARTLVFAAQIAEEFQVALYGYEDLAKHAERKDLAHIRRRQYEGLRDRFTHGELPDFGPSTYNSSVEKHGATAIGIRPLMVAYNVNLSGLPTTLLLPIAKKISALIRERDGGLQGVKSIGWHLPDRDVVQVSCNLTKPNIVGVCDVFLRVGELAKEFNCAAHSSELIGCIPKSQFTTLTPEQLGFNEFKPFGANRILQL